MSFYPFIPPLFAIYLILVSVFTELYAKYLIKNTVQLNIARDWEIRVGAINSVISSLVALYSIFETSKSYSALTYASLILISIFMPLLFWIISHPAGHLSSVLTRIGKLRHGTVCAIILVIVNLVLIGAIYVNQSQTIISAKVQ